MGEQGVEKKSLTQEMIDALQMRNWNLQQKVGQFEKENELLKSQLEKAKEVLNKIKPDSLSCEWRYSDGTYLYYLKADSDFPEALKALEGLED